MRVWVSVASSRTVFALVLGSYVIHNDAPRPRLACAWNTPEPGARPEPTRACAHAPRRALENEGIQRVQLRRFITPSKSSH